MGLCYGVNWGIHTLPPPHNYKIQYILIPGILKKGQFILKPYLYIKKNNNNNNIECLLNFNFLARGK